MNKKTESEILKFAEVNLVKNTRFHDIGHANEVLQIAKKIQKHEGGNLDVIIPACLFHDLSNSSEKVLEGNESTEIAKSILLSIKSFNKESIDKVLTAIQFTSFGTPKTLEEIIVNDADQLSSFTELSIARSFMMNSKRGYSLKESILDMRAFINNKNEHFSNINKVHTKTARVLAKKMYVKIDSILTKMLQNYAYHNIN